MTKGTKMKKNIIIVGGGTAGSVIAAKLSKNHAVTVFEKSEKKRIPFLFRIPLLIGMLYKESNPYIKSIKISFNVKRTVPFFVSNVLGGSSVMNGCVHVFGISKKWENLLNKFGLEWGNLNESYKNIYTKVGERNKIALNSGRKSKLDNLFFKALEDKGIWYGDVESMDVPQAGTVINTCKKIFRSSVMSLLPYKYTNIKINNDVENLIINKNKEIIGVVCNGECFFADYVILCAGVIGTNTLLQKKALLLPDGNYIKLNFNAGIEVKDHTNLRINVKAKYNINSLNEISTSFLKKTLLFVTHLIGLRTLMMGTGATSAAHLDLDNDGIIDTRIQLLNFSEEGRIGSNGNLFSSKNPGFSISITCINPSSTGEIKLKDNRILIKPNYLSTKEDISQLKMAILYVTELLKSKNFKEVVKEIDCEKEMKQNPDEYIQSTAFSGYHLIGGCNNLVDKNFKVNDTEGLYICDASVMCEYVSSNIHSTVVLLADMFATRFSENAIYNKT
jgi:choline dehydrogenase